MRKPNKRFLICQKHPSIQIFKKWADRLGFGLDGLPRQTLIIQLHNSITPRLLPERLPTGTEYRYSLCIFCLQN